MTVEVGISVSGPELVATAKRLIALFDLPLDEQPEQVVAEWAVEKDPTDILKLLAGPTRIVWPNWNLVSYWANNGLLKIDGPTSVLSLQSELMVAAFELAVVQTWFRWEWPEGYVAPSFADMHYPHGWACAFKGPGHDRLVSRRWLAYGPWRLIRDDEHDVSFVQFHDLDADAKTALEQAKPGHQRMGISNEGGFIQSRYVYETDFDGNYLSEDHVLEIVVHGREVPQVEMLDACALRHYQALGAEQPLKNVRYVFMTEDQARAHLHELWLRALECWAIVGGQKVRLDADYEPPTPEKPEWVKRLG